MFSICLPDLEAHVFAWHEFGFMFGSVVKSQLALSVDWSLNVGTAHLRCGEGSLRGVLVCSLVFEPRVCQRSPFVSSQAVEKASSLTDSSRKACSFVRSEVCDCALAQDRVKKESECKASLWL